MMKTLESYIDFCLRYAWQILVATSAVTVLAGYLASGIEIRSDISRLLPETAPSVQGLDRLEAAYGGQLGRLTVVLEGEDPQALEQAADRLSPRLEALEMVDRVEAKKPTAFFRHHRLLYVDLDDLETVKTRIEERIRWEKKRANPLFIPLGDDEPPSVEFSDIESKYGALDQSDYYLDDTGRTLAVFVYPDFPASDLGRARVLSDDVSAVVADVLGDADEVTFGLTGRYEKRLQLQRMLEDDLQVSTTVAFSLIFIFLLLFMRSLTGSAIVVVPLAVGTVWSFAWAEAAFGSLNLLTAFLGAVLLGLGVDYGIHLYTRFVQAAETRSNRDALVETFASAGRASVFAGATTMGALGSLIISDFRAFYEFGVIALGGITLILVAYALVLPVLIALVTRLGLTLRRPVSTTLTSRLVAWLDSIPTLRRLRVLQRLGIGAVVCLATVGCAALVGLPSLHFERSFTVLEAASAPAWALDEKVNQLLGQSQTPAVVLTNSREHSRAVVDEFERRKREMPEGYTIDRVVSVERALPDEQGDKLAMLRELDREFEKLPEKTKNTQLEAFRDEIRHILSHGALAEQDLPVEIRQPFSRRDDASKSVVLVFPSIDLADLDAIGDYSVALADLPGVDQPGGYDAIADSLLLHDITRLVERDAVKMLSITLLGLVAFAVVAFRRRTDIVIQLTTVLTSLLAALGMLGLFGVDLNFLNIMILPIWLGLGVDATFHVLLHLRDNSEAVGRHASLSLALAGAYITSMMGFGAMLLAAHEGLYSLGAAAVVGLGTILIINICLQWALIRGRGVGLPLRHDD
jgi:hypothetical protein